MGKKVLAGLAIVVLLGACDSGGNAVAFFSDPAHAAAVAEAGVGASWFLTDTGYVALLLPSLIGSTVEPGTYPCDEGDFTLVIDDQPPVGELSPGDTVRFTMNGCSFVVDQAFEVSFVYGGTITCVVTRAFDTGSSYDFAFAFTFDGLEIGVDVGDEREETLTVTGDLAVELSSPDGIVETEIMRAGSLMMSIAAATESFSRHLTDYLVTEVSDFDTADFTREIEGTVYDAAMGESVAVHTTVPAMGTGFDPGFPGTGEFLVTGGGGLPVKVVPRDNVRVLLEVDEDGDGEADMSAPAAWADLNWFISRDLIRALLIF
jgi:hypothetical protein